MRGRQCSGKRFGPIISVKHMILNFVKLTYSDLKSKIKIKRKKMQMQDHTANPEMEGVM